MPIIGLTDRGASFPQIGILRKGAPKAPNAPGKDLKHFRLDTKLPDVAQAFKAVYGDEPVSVRVFLPYQTPNANLDAWREEYSASSLIHRCDGETMTIHRTPDGKYSQERKPCPYTTGKQRTKKEPGCKPVARLKVIVPELQRLAYLVVQSTSIHDIIELTGNLDAAYALRNDLRGIPFILRRAPRMISMPKEDGTRQRVEKWLLSLEPAPDWVQLQITAMSYAALPVVEGEYTALTAPSERLALTSGSTVDLETGEVFDDEDDDETIAAPTPRTPEQLREHLRNSAHANANEPELTIGWRDGLIGTIDKMTEENGHHAFLAWAFDSATGSRKDVTNGQLHALKGWLQTHSETQVVEGKDGQREEKKVWVLNEIPAAELLAAYPVALAAMPKAPDFPAADDLHPDSAHLVPA